MRIGSGGGVRGWRLALTSTLTALRILLIPLFLLIAQATTSAPPDDQLPLRWLAVACLCAVGISDVLDGFLARRLGTQSHAGTIADALIDKAVQLSLLTYFTVEGSETFWNVPAWLLGLVIGRDVLLLGGGLAHLIWNKPVPAEHSHYGRAGTVLIFGLLVGITLDAPPAWLSPLTVLTAVMVVLSTTLYALRARRVWKHGEVDRIHPRSGSR